VFPSDLIHRVVRKLSQGRLRGRLPLRNLRGQAFEQPLAPVLAHVFIHQTHHRGQAHTLLTQLGREAPELDLIYFLREQG
jgi:uncharacterized damage-inducible protein DinB